MSKIAKAMHKDRDILYSKHFRKSFYDYGNYFIDVKTGKKWLPIEFPTGDLEHKR